MAESLVQLIDKLDAIDLPVTVGDWSRISKVLRLAISTIDSLFQEIEHGDKEHRKWLWEKLDQHFAEFRREL